MPIYKIAGINVLMNPKYETLKTQAMPYITDEENIDIEISITDEYLNVKKTQYPHLSLDDCEYIYIGAEFYRRCLDFGCFMLHSSAVAQNDEAYLFSAPSGTGKSTHVGLWLKNFEGAFVINDDKPAIKLVDGKFYVYGTPFSGKTDLNKNVCLPLKAICILERGKENIIKKIEPKDAALPILNQTLRPENKMGELMAIVSKLLKDVNVYKLYCNTDDEAAIISYNTMRKGD